MSELFQYVLWFCFGFTVLSGCAFLLVLLWMGWPHRVENARMRALKHVNRKPLDGAFNAFHLDHIEEARRRRQG